MGFAIKLVWLEVSWPFFWSCCETLFSFFGKNESESTWGLLLIVIVLVAFSTTTAEEEAQVDVSRQDHFSNEQGSEESGGAANTDFEEDEEDFEDEEDEEDEDETEEDFDEDDLEEEVEIMKSCKKDSDCDSKKQFCQASSLKVIGVKGTCKDYATLGKSCSKSKTSTTKCASGLVCTNTNLINSGGTCRKSCTTAAKCKSTEYCTVDNYCLTIGDCDSDQNCKDNSNTFAKPACRKNPTCTSNGKCKADKSKGC